MTIFDNYDQRLLKPILLQHHLPADPDNIRQKNPALNSTQKPGT